MTQTLKRIGQAIRAGSQYLPIRNYAAAIATQAGPKDFLGQAQAIFDDLTQRRWRYVKDPVSAELLTYSPQALYNLVLGGDGIGVGLGKGAGDCDCITALSGALLESIGVRTRLATTAPRNAAPGRLMTHVFLQAQIPRVGWMTFDPVLYPVKPMGEITDHSRLAVWDLDGRLISISGNTTAGLTGELLGGIEMYNREYSPYLGEEQWSDLGPMLGFAEDGELPDDFRKYGLRDFGMYSEKYGILGGMGLAAEATYQVINGQLVSRSPMLELAIEDYQHMARGGRPYHGMMALGDDASVYAYDGFAGFFKRLWGGIKKIGKKIGKGIKRVIKKIPGGKYLIRLGEKIYKVAAKFVKPLWKLVGKYATKLAPIVAFVPGVGTAAAAALFTAGKVVQLMDKWKVKLTGKKGKVRGLKFTKGKKSAKAFKRDMERAAKELKHRKKREAKKQHAQGARRAQRTQARRIQPIMAPMMPRYGRSPSSRPNRLRDSRPGAWA